MELGRFRGTCILGADDIGIVTILKKYNVDFNFIKLVQLDSCVCLKYLSLGLQCSINGANNFVAIC